MELEIITLYVICDEFLWYMNRNDHPDSEMRDADRFSGGAHCSTALSIIVAVTAFTLFFAPGGVAPDTILKIKNTFFTMFGFNIGRGMFVTTVTGICLQTIGVTGCTRANSAFTVIHGEWVRPGVLGRSPGCGRVAFDAHRTILALMGVILLVTAEAVGGGTLVNVVEVTGLAFQRHMCSGQGECG